MKQIIHLTISTIGLLLLCNNLMLGQSLEELRKIADSLSTIDYAQSIATYQRIVEKAQADKDGITLTQTYNNMSDVAYKNARLDQMIKFAEQGAAAIEQYKIPNDSSVVQLNYLEFGTYYTERSDYDKAAQYQKKALDHFFTQSPPDSARILVAANNIAVTYKRKNDFEKAVDYYTIAENHINFSQRQSSHINLGIIYSNIGQAYSEYEQHRKAEEYFNKSLPVFDKNKNSPTVAYALPSVYNNMALMYSATKEFDKGLSILKKSTQLNLSEVQQLILYNTRGYIHYNKGNYDKAISDLSASLALREKRYPANSAQRGVTYNHLGKVYLAKQDYISALDLHQKALVSLLYEYDDSDIYSAVNLVGIVSEKHLLTALHAKAKTFYEWHKKEQNLKHLEAAYYNYQQTIKLIEMIRRGYRSEGSKQFLNQNTNEIFEEAIEVTEILYRTTNDFKYANVIFQLTEQSKAVLLLEALKSSDALEFGDLPPSLLEKERNLKLDVLYYEKKIYAAQQKKDQASLDLYTNYQIKTQEEYDNFISKIEQDYPNYFDLKYNTTIPNISDIQRELLTTEKVMIEYFVGKKSIYSIAISKDDVSIQKQVIEADFRQSILAFRKSLTDLSYIQDSLSYVYETYEKAGYEWFSKLLADAIKSYDARQLIIIPDGLLNYIPFEALLYEQPLNSKSFRTLPYLILRYDVQYAYSATLLQRLANKKSSNTKHNYGGFAATYDDNNTKDLKYVVRSGAAPLPNAVKEIKQIAKIMHGKAQVGTNASEYFFKKKASSYNVLHFAMHGILDDENPMFSHLLFTNTTDTFDDAKLTALEIYNLPLRAELAVLSACNTGYGKLRMGEGVMSLSRAFAYAGTPSTIMSLWSVPDASSSEIMISFFEKMATQKDVLKSQALREAKLNYLEDKDAFLSHPVFWAGFTPIGDMSPLTISSSNKMYWYIGGGILILLLLSLWLPIRRNQH